jgi:hypothetical protein
MSSPGSKLPGWASVSSVRLLEVRQRPSITACREPAGSPRSHLRGHDRLRRPRLSHEAHGYRGRGGDHAEGFSSLRDEFNLNPSYISKRSRNQSGT